MLVASAHGGLSKRHRLDDIRESNDTFRDQAEVTKAEYDAGNIDDAIASSGRDIN